MKLIILLLAVSFASSSTIPGNKIHFISLPKQNNTSSQELNSTNSFSSPPSNSSSSPLFPDNVFVARAHFLPNTTICPMGFLKTTSEDGFECSKPFCHLDTDCTLLFGGNSTCDQLSGSCVCDVDHSVDEEQKCTIFTGPSTTTSETYDNTILNSTCYDNSQCSVIFGAECRSNVCECSFGFIPYFYSDSNYTGCKKANCAYNSAYCQSLFNDPNVICDAYVDVCRCADNFAYNQDLRSCQPEINQLGAECFANEECDSNTASCVNNVCACQLGFVQNRSLSAYACQQVSCSDDWDCEVQTSNGTSCNWDGTCECSYEKGFTLDSSSQQCKRRANLLGAECFDDGDCGEGANCVYSKCRCESGNSAEKNNMDCSQVNCQEDSDCQVLDPNSKCGFFNTCSCKDGFSISYSLQKCTSDEFSGNDDDDDDDDDGYNWSLSTSVSILVLFSVLLILFGVSIAVARNRAEVARQQQLLQRQRQRQRAQQNATAYVTSTANVTIPVTQKS